MKRSNRVLIITTNVMVAITTIPYCVSYKMIPLSVFDNLQADEKPI